MVFRSMKQPLCLETHFSITVPDPDHSLDEDRFIIVGMSHLGRLLIVAHSERGENICLISARGLTPYERTAYKEGDF